MKIAPKYGGVGPLKRTNFLPFTRDYRGMAKHTPLHKSLEPHEFDSLDIFFFLVTMLRNYTGSALLVHDQQFFFGLQNSLSFMWNAT